MSDLISREDAIAKFKKSCTSESIDKNGIKRGEIHTAMTYEGIIKIIESLPSAEPERKTFHVIDKKTGKEADPYEIALNEDWAKSLCYCDMVGFAVLEDGTLILVDECGRFEFIQENDRFEIVWDEVTNDQ